jgi:hypothetical protein
MADAHAVMIQIPAYAWLALCAGAFLNGSISAALAFMLWKRAYG